MDKRFFVSIIYIMCGDDYLNNTMSKIIDLFKNCPDVLYGFSSSSYTDYADKYKSILIYEVPHSELLTLETYTEEKFESLIFEARKKVNIIQNEIENILINENCLYEIPPVAQTSEETLIAPLSFKFVAVNSGLGWIGKNGVLVTEKYGARVRLAALLIDDYFSFGKPITESRCPTDCVKCIKSCPHKALSGQQWNINIKRFELIDYHLCNQKRSLYINSHNRKHSCGLCMVSCPLGL